jgi:iron complex transport system ATP-binding protein
MLQQGSTVSVAKRPEPRANLGVGDSAANTTVANGTNASSANARGTNASSAHASSTAACEGFAASIATEGIAVAYDDLLVIEKLDVRVPQGRITTIIGPNGCGKSTLLKAMGRIIKPKAGWVYLNGEDIRTMSTREIAQKMGILPQSPQTPAGLTVGELVSYGRFPHQRGFNRLTSEDREILAWALEVTRLTEYETTEVDTLSGGQRQRVWIAMALAQMTDLILLDEPTTFLDLAYQLEVLELLYQLNREQGRTIVMVLHDLNLAARFADYMLAMRKGSIICQGPPEEVMTSKTLRELFQINARITLDPITERPLCLSYDLLDHPVQSQNKNQGQIDRKMACDPGLPQNLAECKRLDLAEWNE